MNDIGNPASRVERKFGKARHVGFDFAADGDWKHSKSFLYNSKSQGNPDEIFVWLGQQNKKTDNVAVEALFRMKSGARFFFGVGTHYLSSEERKRAIGEFLKMPQDGSSLVETIDRIRSAFRCPLPLDTIPRHLDVGVRGLWIEVGSLTVWEKNRGRRILSFEKIKKIRTLKPNNKSRPPYGEQPNNVMLEAHMGVEGQTFLCWLGYPVSKPAKSSPYRRASSKKAYYSVAKILSGCSLMP